MKTIEETIAWFEGRVKSTTMPGARSMFEVAISALRAQQERENPKQITNADRIRSMSDEDLAWELMLWRCEAVAKHHGIESQYPDTQSKILGWLQQPAEEG